MRRDADGRLVVMYDGDCGLCTRTSRLLDRLDRGGRLELVPFSEARARNLAPDLTSEEFAASFHVAAGGRTVSGADAIPFVLERLPGGRWPARWIRRSTLLRRLVERSYETVARNRGRWNGDRCAPGHR